MKTIKLVCGTLRLVVFIAAACVAGAAASPRVTTVAGGFLGDGQKAVNASFAAPIGVARDTRGNVYVSDSYNCRIRRIDSSGVISTFAGTGIWGYSGDSGPARAAMIANPHGIAIDPRGALLIADTGNSRIRRVSPGGVITTIAGNGSSGYSGDGGPATEASLSGPVGVFVTASGTIYIADTGNNVVRFVDAAGIIHTIAGNHTAGFSGDGGPATSASLNFPWSVAVDAKGNAYISDTNNYRVRIVDAGGTINTYAGDGSFGNTGGGGAATGAAIGAPGQLLLGGGKLYFGGSVVWAVTLSTQIIEIVAGNGNTGFNGDGNSALMTAFYGPQGLAFDGAGGLLLVDWGNGRVRHVDARQIVSTLAGGAVGDGGPATSSSVNFASTSSHLSFDPSGNLYIADTSNCRVRKVTRAGAISTLAGTGVCGYSGDGGPGSSATLFLPQSVAADGNGNVYIGDVGNQVIRRVDSNGTISTFLQLYTCSNCAETANAAALAVDSNGNVYASDGSTVIWKITPSGSTSIVAGMLGMAGYNGDGIPATHALLDFPTGITVDRAGNLYISDWLNNRIRKVDTNGTISTIAGNGMQGFAGDGGPATSAMLFLPLDVAVDGSGNVYIADWINFRIRVVNASGIIETIAGSGGFGYNGDKLPARKTNLFPIGVAVSPAGVVHYADQSTYRVRRIR